MKRIAVDTNVLVRLLARIESEQSKTAMRLAASHQVFVSQTVLLETEWVLRSVIGASRGEVNNRFEELLGMASIEIEHPGVVETALKLHSVGMDFADALHVCGLQEGDRFLTFDRDLVKLANRHMNEISVELAH
jgi:predicted nucleic-acid-binding protein